MLDLLLASGNAHKAKELSVLLDKNLFSITAATEKLEVEEDGETYTENAFLKADSYFEKFKVPVISDDSGLTVDALPGEMGIHSARFGGEGLTNNDRVELLLEKLKDVEDELRSAYFTCVLSVYLSPEQVFFFEGRLDGFIGREMCGTDGFGYDPVFKPRGREGATLAMIPEWKQINSHRALACHAAQKFFKERVCQTS